MSHVQYMLRTGWNCNISRAAVCFATSVVSRPCVALGAKGKTILDIILNRVNLE
jgi:hypothetical protein